MRTEAKPNRIPAILAAAALHAGLFALALYAWPTENTPVTISSVPVQIVSDAPATAPQISPDPPAEVASEAVEHIVEPVETPPPPPPLPDPTPPKPTPAPPKKLTPTPKPTPAKPTPPKTAPVKRRDAPAFDPSSIADSLSDAKARRRPAATPNPATKPGGAPQKGPSSATGTIDSSALRSKLIELWLPNCVTTGWDEVRPRVRFTLSKDGRVVGGPTVLNRGEGRAWQFGAERALSAVRAGEPYDDLPKELLGIEHTVIFDARVACS